MFDAELAEEFTHFVTGHFVVSLGMAGPLNVVISVFKVLFAHFIELGIDRFFTLAEHKVIVVFFHFHTHIRFADITEEYTQ